MTDILMPKVGLTMTEGLIVEWHKQPGQAVQQGERLFTFETEKSTLEFESPVAGVLERILAPAGQVMPCLAPVAVVAAAAAVPADRAPRRPASPRAKALARELGIDLAAAGASAPGGVIVERDVIAAAQPGSGPASEAAREGVAQAAARMAPDAVALSPARRLTAQRMAENARAAPHVTLTTEADATGLADARAQLAAELGENVSYNTLLAAIAARALKEHPALNASWVDDSGAGPAVIVHQAIHIGVAVDTPRGLVVPVLRDAGTQSLIALHRALADLVARASAGRLAPDDMRGGTFTLTNLGMHEIDAFTPIINLPEAAILGVGRIAARPVARGESVVVRQMMALSLAFDHRVVDGAPAARFLQRVKALIERPFALLA